MGSPLTILAQSSNKPPMYDVKLLLLGHQNHSYDMKCMIILDWLAYPNLAIAIYLVINNLELT